MDASAAPTATTQEASLGARIEALANEAIAQGKLPGCVIALGRSDGIFYLKAFGNRALLPQREPMTEDTIFDLASLTKPVATAMSILVLADQGKLALDDPVARYWPEFGTHGKSAITIRQLLVHVSGLPSETPLGDYEHGRAEAMKRIAALSPKSSPGERFIYSDLGYLILQEILRRVSGEDPARFADENIFKPLRMVDTGFGVPESARPRVAPTEERHGAWMRGEVHDPRAFRLGGVAGHAGLFSTARDLARFARVILGHGQLDGARIVSAAALARMLAPHDVPGGIRTPGWDVRSAYSNHRGDSLSRHAVGHGGYTGTTLWIDPDLNLFVVFLSNRVHPDGKGQANTLAAAVASLAGKFVEPPDPPTLARAGFALGIDVLLAEGFARLRGRRVALLTNDSARAQDGRRTTDVLAASRDVNLVALMSPEHGLSARRDERILDDVDGKTRLPIFSLYGGSRSPRMGGNQGPRPVNLPDDIDTVVVDLPDVGTRFFTYASTVHGVLRAAADRSVRVLILDRPNPLNGVDVAGPMLKPSELSAVNHHALPIRHGMTMGELAEMMNADDHLGVHLEVVRMHAYDRRSYADQLGLPWWPPSPNLRTVDEAVLYPGVALLEATNISVGRGTETPFEVLGAPWIIDGRALVAEMTDTQVSALSGLKVEPAHFTPRESTYKNQPCHGLRLRVLDRSRFDPVRVGLALAIALRKLYPEAWEGSHLRRMLGDPDVAAALLGGKPLADLEALYEKGLAAFRTKRLKYLLYPP